MATDNVKNQIKEMRSVSEKVLEILNNVVEANADLCATVMEFRSSLALETSSSNSSNGGDDELSNVVSDNVLEDGIVKSITNALRAEAEKIAVERLMTDISTPISTVLQQVNDDSSSFPRSNTNVSSSSSISMNINEDDPLNLDAGRPLKILHLNNPDAFIEAKTKEIFDSLKGPNDSNIKTNWAYDVYKKARKDASSSKSSKRGRSMSTSGGDDDDIEMIQSSEISIKCPISKSTFVHPGKFILKCVLSDISEYNMI